MDDQEPKEKYLVWKQTMNNQLLPFSEITPLCEEKTPAQLADCESFVNKNFKFLTIN